MLHNNKLFCILYNTIYLYNERPGVTGLIIRHTQMSGQWHIIAACDDVEDGDGITVVVDDKEIAVFRSGQNYYATDSSCTHAGAPLVDGYLEGRIIECPLHQGRFDLRNGKALCSPATVDLKIYSTRTVNGEIQIRI